MFNRRSCNFIQSRRIPHSRRFQTTHLRPESLEDRRLLAFEPGLGTLDLVAQPAPYVGRAITDVFARHAVTVEDMIARANVVTYIPNQLVVAYTQDLARGADPSQPTVPMWAERLGSDSVSTIANLMNTTRGDGVGVTLVHLDLGANGDVIQAMRELQDDVDVLWSAPNFASYDDPRELIPNDPQYNQQYHHPLMRNNLAWDVTLGSPNIIIGITDDGFQLNHVDLQSNIWVNPGEIPNNGIDDDGNGYIDDVNGWDFITGNNNPNPNSSSNSHGTHVAGIAAARTNNGLGLAGTAGGSTILPIQFYDSSLGWNAAEINLAFRYGADNGAKIMSTSYNIDGWVGDPTFTAGLQYAYDRGVLLFNSAGNGSALNPPRQAFEQTLLVASTDSADIRSSFSNFGTGVDIAAPGSNILSTLLNNTYGLNSGTSMATPNAAGVAALIWSANPNWTREQVAAQLLSSADNIDGLNPAYAGLLGAGRVNSFRGVSEVVAPPKIKVLNNIPTGTVGASTQINHFFVGYSTVMDAATVTNPANYDLRTPGLDGVFDTADDQILAVSVPNPYRVSTNLLRVNINSGNLGVGNYRLRIQSGGVRDALGNALDGDGNGTGGDAFERFFAISINPFERQKSIGSLISASKANPGTLQGAADAGEFPTFVEAGELLSVIATPQNPAATLSAELVGVTGVVTAPAPGAPVVIPAALVNATGNVAVRITGNQGTAYTFDVYRNANIAALVESPNPVNIANSLLPLGSGRYAAVGQSTVGDVDEFQIDLTGKVGKSFDIIVSGLGTTSMATQSVQLRDSGGILVATAAAGANNYDLGIRDYVVASGGVHTIRVSTTVATQYSVIVMEDAVFDTEINNSIAPSLRNLNNAKTALGYLAEGAINFVTTNNPSLFVDISGTGTPLNLTDDQEVTINTTVGNAIIPAGAVTVANNGGVLAGGGRDLPFTNTTLPSTAFGAALLPFWDDIDDETGNVYWRQQLVGGINTLIVQWQDRPHYTSSGGVGTATFQVQLFESGPIAARFVYIDVDFGNVSFNNGASATVGVQLTSTQAFTYSFNTPSLSAGQVIDIYMQERDLYSIDLAAGEQLIVRTATPFDAANRTPLNALDPKLAILDANDNVLAADSNSLDGKNARLTFTAPAAGTYYIAVGNDSGTGEYVLKLGPESSIDGDFNDDGFYDCADINALVQAVVNGGPVAQFDLNGDGALSLLDVDAWRAEAGGVNLGIGRVYRVGDANLDGVVDGSDYNVWNAHKFTLNAAWCSGDFNADGAIDGSDYNLWNANKFTSSDNGREIPPWIDAIRTRMERVAEMEGAITTDDRSLSAFVDQSQDRPLAADAVFSLPSLSRVIAQATTSMSALKAQRSTNDVNKYEMERSEIELW